MKIVIIGHGGHGKVIRDLILAIGRHEIAGYLDDKYQAVSISENTFFGPISSVRNLIPNFNEIKFVVGVGNNLTRKSIVQRTGLSDDQFITLVHPSAVVSSSARIANGTVIMANAVVNADTQIGRHAIINTSSVIEHDCQLGDFVHVSPNAALTGSVKVEEETHVGAGASIIPNVKIGKGCVIGAGATVIHDLPSYSTAVGVPARVKMKKATGGGQIAGASDR